MATFETSLALAQAATDPVAKYVHSYNAAMQARTPDQRVMALELYQRPVIVKQNVPARRINLPRNWATTKHPSVMAHATNAPTLTPTPLPQWLQTQTVSPIKGTLQPVSYDPTKWDVPLHSTDWPQPTMPPSQEIVANPYMAWNAADDIYATVPTMSMPEPGTSSGPASFEAYQPNEWDAFAPWDASPWSLSPTPAPTACATCAPCSK